MLQRNNVNFECIDGVITLEDSDKSVQMLRDAEVSYLSRRGRLVLQDDSDSEGSSPVRGLATSTAWLQSSESLLNNCSRKAEYASYCLFSLIAVVIVLPRSRM